MDAVTMDEMFGDAPEWFMEVIQPTPVFEIVEADASDPLAALRPQAVQPVDWRDTLAAHLNQVRPAVWAHIHQDGCMFEDTSDRLSKEFLEQAYAEFQSVINGPHVRWMVYDEDGNLVEG